MQPQVHKEAAPPPSLSRGIGATVTNPGVFPRKNVQRLNFGCYSFYGAIRLNIREEYDTLGQCELLRHMRVPVEIAKNT